MGVMEQVFATQRSRPTLRQHRDGTLSVLDGAFTYRGHTRDGTTVTWVADDELPLGAWYDVDL
jgi:hypothetical protein